LPESRPRTRAAARRFQVLRGGPGDMMKIEENA
jgi:hypothetical protein